MTAHAEKTMPQSVYAVFESAARQWPARDLLDVLPGTAAAYAIAPGKTSYHSMYRDANTLADRFAKSGYLPGMRVALLLENRPLFFTVWLALNRLGVSVVPINPDLRARELQFLIEHAEPALMVTTTTRLSELKTAAASSGIELSVVDNLNAIPTPRKNAQVAAQSDHPQEREAAVLYTSGTTGNPKGCVLPNAYYLMAGNWYATVGGLATLNTEGERMITPLPVFHMNAMAYSFMAMLYVGGCLCLLDRFHPSTWWEDVRMSKATCLHYLGVMPTLLMAGEPTEQDKEHSIRFGFGAGVDPKLHASFEQRFGFPLIEAWAMTETGAGAVVAASTPDRLVGVSCLGRFASNIEYRVIDDKGQDVGHHQPGQLLVRHAGNNPGLGFFTQYYKDEKATAEAWHDGWFHTGDIVQYDEQSNIYFIDRKKNVIRRSGENIAAVEVESVLMRHSAVKAAAVTAVPDDIRGDEVFACLQVESPSEALAAELTQWCLSQIAYYKAPGYIAFVETLPLTATQKIQRATLKAQAAQLLHDSQTIKTLHLKKRQVHA